MDLHEAHVLLVDDDPGIQGAVKRALESSGTRVSVFSSAEACVNALGQQTCDAVIADIIMDGMGGMSLLHNIKRHFPWLPVIIVTGYGDIPLAVAAMKAGAADFLEKPLDRQQLLSAVKRVLDAAVKPDHALRQGLSRMEAQVLRNILDGKTSRQIATALNRSIRTIEAHRHRLLHKFGAKNVAQLVQRADVFQSRMQ
jgi:two-component system response regulator FixJ